MKRAAKWLLPRAALMIILITSFPVVHAATLSLTYDANGNLITGDGRYRVYDGYNQLRYVYNGTNASVLLQEYEYHPIEERVLSKKTYFANGSLDETVIYFSKQNVRVINNSGSFDFQYIYHEGQLIAQVNPDGTKIFIHSDHLGSSTVVTNATGDVMENTTYTPHGEILNGGSEIRYGYEGKEHDSILGDTDFNARRYKFEWGLFTQPDSLLPNVYDPQQLNRYMFERGNPYKYTDPTGHFNRNWFGFGAGTAALIGVACYATGGIGCGVALVIMGPAAFTGLFAGSILDESTDEETRKKDAEQIAGIAPFTDPTFVIDAGMDMHTAQKAGWPNDSANNIFNLQLNAQAYLIIISNNAQFGIRTDGTVRFNDDSSQKRTGDISGGYDEGRGGYVTDDGRFYPSNNPDWKPGEYEHDDSDDSGE